MNKVILDYINKCEGWKTAIKSLHWDADNLPQHQLCDDIATLIADFQDKVSEVQQSIDGKLEKNLLHGDNYKVSNLRKFVEDVLDDTNKFYHLIPKDDNHTGMISDCESFLSDMQRKLYLVNFTMKENMMRRIAARIVESKPKNLANVDTVEKYKGRRPTNVKSRINKIYNIVKKYGINSRVYSDENWSALDDYEKAIESLGCNVSFWCKDGGYGDYNNEGAPMSKTYNVSIEFDDGMEISGYIKMMACGTNEYPFSKYDTCIILWSKIQEEDITRITNDTLSRILESVGY